jgi:hypothetical protein
MKYILMHQVQNIIGSSESSTRAKAHYKKYADWPELCCAQGCKNTAIHGGHVKARGYGLFVWYIIPVCQNPHNLPASNTTFKVKKIVAVEDNVSFNERVLSWKHDLAKLFLSDRF